jgi:hypothetical protein
MAVMAARWRVFFTEVVDVKRHVVCFKLYCFRISMLISLYKYGQYCALDASH